MNQFCEKKWEIQDFSWGVNNLNSSAFWAIDHSNNVKILYATLERACGALPADSKVTPGGDLVRHDRNTYLAAHLMNVNVKGDGSGEPTGKPSYRLIVGFTNDAGSMNSIGSSMLFKCAMNATNNGDAVQFKSFSKSDGGTRGVWSDAQPGGKNECMPVELISFASGSPAAVNWDSLNAGGTSGGSQGAPDQNLKSEIDAYTFIMKEGKILVADPVDGVKWEQFTGRESSHFRNAWSYWYKKKYTNEVVNVGYPNIIAVQENSDGGEWGYIFVNKSNDQELTIAQGQAGEKYVSGNYVSSSGTALHLCQTKNVSNEDKALSAVFSHLESNGFKNVTLDQFCYSQWNGQ